MIDSTIVKVHQHTSGTKGGQELQAIGRSVGGLSTKIHLLAYGKGLPLKFYFTESKTHDTIPSIYLPSNLTANYFIGAKAYDATKLINFLEQQNVESVIP